MTVRYTLGLAEFRAFSRAVALDFVPVRFWTYLLAGPLVATVLIATFAAEAGGLEGLLRTGLVPTLVLAAGGIGWSALVWRRLERQAQRLHLADVSGQRTVTLDAAGFHIQHGAGQRDLAWSAVHSVVERRGLVLVIQRRTRLGINAIAVALPPETRAAFLAAAQAYWEAAHPGGAPQAT